MYVCVWKKINFIKHFIYFHNTATLNGTQWPFSFWFGNHCASSNISQPSEQANSFEENEWEEGIQKKLRCARNGNQDLVFCSFCDMLSALCLCYSLTLAVALGILSTLIRNSCVICSSNDNRVCVIPGG